jgi:hypothetical protein
MPVFPVSTVSVAHHSPKAITGVLHEMASMGVIQKSSKDGKIKAFACL